MGESGMRETGMRATETKKTWLRVIWVGVFALFAGASVTTWSGTADAHDGIGCGGGVVRGGSYRNCRHPSTRIVAPRRGCGCGWGVGARSFRGGSWIALRRGLGQGSFYDPTRRWVRDHYLRRFPFLLVEGEEAARMEVLLSEDLLAVMSEEQGKEAKLDPATQLDRAAARFFVADYDGARADLKAVASAEPKEPRAHWGLFFCAMCQGEWEDAGSELKVLARAGEIKPGDRVDPDAVFGNPKVYPGIAKGLRTLADLKVTDGTIHAITAWTLASQGELDMAKRYLRMAKQWDADGATTAALQGMVSGKAAKPAPKPPVPAPVKPKTNGDATFRAPQDPALQRQIAKAAPKKRITYVENK